MNYRTFDIIIKPSQWKIDGWMYKIYGLGHPKTPDKIRCRRAMTGFDNEEEATQKAKAVIDLKIKEGKWCEAKLTDDEIECCPTCGQETDAPDELCLDCKLVKADIIHDQMKEG